MSNNINNSKLVGGKRKNGHKLDCACHICENMENKAKRGGYEEEVEKKREYLAGGSKKKNGHRKVCKCPICINMKNSKKICGKKSNKKTKKTIGGGYNDEDETKKDDEEEEEEILGDTDMDIDNDTDSSDEEEGQEEEKYTHKKKRSNGHKTDCNCPICKNMRNKKGGEEPDIENQIGDIEEAGIKSTTGPYTNNETTASTGDYDALEAAERGEAGLNVVGGTRKRRRVGSRKRRGCGSRKRRGARKMGL